MERRRWDPWSHDEEQAFFSALKAVGKDFPQISREVGSKTKEQVRHYFYRTVKRLKELLGPGFSESLSQSRETCAALLSWWSLLQEHKCAPQRHRMSSDSLRQLAKRLGHQMLMDRESNDNTPFEATTGKADDGSEEGAAKIAYSNAVVNPLRSNRRLDARSVQATCGTPSPLHLQGVSDGRKDTAEPDWLQSQNCRKMIVSSPSRQSVCTKQAAVTKRVFVVSSPPDVAGSKRNIWNHAFNPGLPGDVEVHKPEGDSINEMQIQGLERQGMSSDREKIHDTERDMLDFHSGKHQSAELPTRREQALGAAKIKLQLYPMDRVTNLSLQKDGFNPHVELVLKANKSAAAVAERLAAKWENASASKGKLRLLPYEGTLGSDRASWGDESVNVTVGEIWASLGGNVFRLRYGWAGANAEDQLQHTPAMTVEDGEDGAQALCSNLEDARPRQHPEVCSSGRIRSEGRSPFQDETELMVSFARANPSKRPKTADHDESLSRTREAHFSTFSDASEEMRAIEARTSFRGFIERGSIPGTAGPAASSLPPASILPVAEETLPFKSSHEGVACSDWHAKFPQKATSKVFFGGTNSFLHDLSRDGFGCKAWGAHDSLLKNDNLLEMPTLGGNNDSALLEEGLSIGSKPLRSSSLLMPSDLPSPLGDSRNLQEVLMTDLWGHEDTRDGFGVIRTEAAEQGYPEQLPKIGELRSLDGHSSVPSMELSDHLSTGILAGLAQPRSAETSQTSVAFDLLWADSLGSIGIVLPNSN